MWTLNPMYGFFQSVCMPDCAKEKISDFLASAWAKLNVPEFGLGNSATECEGLAQPSSRAAVSASVRLDMMRMAGCVIDLPVVFQHWLTAGQQTGWSCDQPSTSIP